MTSGPYKSKVLNFVSAKYRQILTQSDRAFRNVKFAATNTVQMLLYPMYVLLQASRLAVKQLRQRVVGLIPQTIEKVNNKTIKNNQTADQPIQEVLVAEAKLPLPSISQAPITEQSEIFSKLEIAENYQVSNILTRVKQENPLILETAKIEKKVPLQLQPCAELVPMFGPIGGVWQIMAWVQTSKIALWFNLFEEWNIALEQNEPKHQNRGFAIYQSQPLLSSANLTFGEFIHNLAKQYLYPITRGLGLNGLLPPFKIEELDIDSVLEAELGQEKQQKRSGPVASVVLPCQPETFQVAISLTTTPLISPGNIEKLGNEKNFPLHQQPSEENILTSNNSAKKEAIGFKEALRQVHRYKKEETFDYTMNSAKISVQTYSSESRPKHQPNWLEVESVSVGYVKHPLEKILGWVDVIMTWLEKLVAQVWQLCQQKLKNF